MLGNYTSWIVPFLFTLTIIIFFHELGHFLVARFPALALARQALQAGNGAPTVLNAANEVAVHEFIGGWLGFAGIAALVDATMAAGGRASWANRPASTMQLPLTIFPELWHGTYCWKLP
jgi:1-deoxy-D-xylulose 5-phosphate reductoisomerase